MTPFNKVVCEVMELNRPRTSEKLRDEIKKSLELRDKKEETKKATKKMRYCR